MKHSVFGIIELLRNNIPTEAHAMNNSITQDNQNDNQISKTIKKFFARFHVTSALKTAGNAGESHQYQLLRHETVALYGRNLVTVQGWQCTGVQVCP